MYRRMTIMVAFILAVSVVARVAAAPEQAATVINPLVDPQTIAIFTDAPSTASVRAAGDGDERCVEVAYTLLPNHAWGSWLSLVLEENKQQPRDLSACKSLTVSFRVTKGAPVPTVVRVSIYDVNENGAYEWYYAQNDTVLNAVNDQWTTLSFSLAAFKRPPGSWNPPVNDSRLDLHRIGRIEISVVTTREVRSAGTFLMKELVATDAGQ